MGLDMYLYKAECLSDDEVVKIRENEYVPDVLLLDSVSGDDVKDLAPFVRKVKTEVKELDKKKLAVDYPGDIGCMAVSMDSVMLVGFLGDKSVTYYLTLEEYESYFSPVTKDRYAVKMSQIAYWRKNNSLQEALYEAYDGVIENCGFYKVNDRMDRFLMSHIPENDGSYFYHEWY